MDNSIRRSDVDSSARKVLPKQRSRAVTLSRGLSSERIEEYPPVSGIEGVGTGVLLINQRALAGRRRVMIELHDTIEGRNCIPYKN